MKDDAIPLDEERFLKLKPKILLSIIALAGAAVASWGAIKFDLRDVRRDVADHSKTLEQMTAQLQIIETEARNARETTARIENTSREATARIESASREAELKNRFTQELINQKLDYLTGDKRGPRPAAGPP